MIRGGTKVSDSSVWKARPLVRVALVGARAPGGRLCTSSTRLFQVPQAWHWPAHLEWAPPQAWQT